MAGTELTYPFKAKKRVTSSFQGHLARTPPSTAPGTDFGADWGEPVYAPIAGTINAARWWGAGGRAMWIHWTHDPQNVRVYLAHLSSVVTLSHERVEAGDLVGFVGSTGNSTGPHLHLSFKLQGRWVDPMEYMEEPGRQDG